MEKIYDGNAKQYGFSLIPERKDSALRGKEICILGSSVAYGAASGQKAVGEYLAARFGCALTKEAVSGTTLVDDEDESYVRRLHRIDPKKQFAFFLCQLSTNDSTQGKPLGKICEESAEFDTAAITGAIEYIICYARRTWGCPVGFFTGSRYDSAFYGTMVKRLLELQKKYDIFVADLWTPDSFNQITEEQRKLYMADPIHPTMAGYRDWWGPEIERQLLSWKNI